MRVLLVVLIALPSCISAPPAREAAGPTASVRPTEALDEATRTTCAARVLGSLVDAINRQDGAALDRLIGDSPTHSFEWVSMSSTSEVGPTFRSPGANEVSYTAAGGRQLLLARSQQSERWTLVSVRAGDGPSWHGGVDAEVHLERHLRDGRVVKTAGKTALSCTNTVIYVLSLGDE